MRSDKPSFTAAWVAAMRGLGAFLPEPLRLVDDPYGLRFAGRMRVLRDEPRLARGARVTSRLWMRGGLRGFAVYMQLRTRAIDDDLAAFVRAGGRQIVLLGAGFDCRAWRLAGLAGATVFEVDHPATQAKKRAVMTGEPTSAQVVFVPWDFERERLDELPARLGLDGHDVGAPTMTILEGVLMYLTESARDATLATIRRYSAPGSPLAMTYMTPSVVDGGLREGAARRLAVRVVGEPFRSGLSPSEVPVWLERRGFRLDRDESAAQAGSRLLGPAAAPKMSPLRAMRSHFALVRRA